jgi:hypothetical protein
MCGGIDSTVDRGNGVGTSSSITGHRRRSESSVVRCARALLAHAQYAQAFHLLTTFGLALNLALLGGQSTGCFQLGTMEKRAGSAGEAVVGRGIDQ